LTPCLICATGKRKTNRRCHTGKGGENGEDGFLFGFHGIRMGGLYTAVAIKNEGRGSRVPASLCISIFFAKYFLALFSQ